MKLGIRYVPESHSSDLDWFTTDLSNPGWFYYSDTGRASKIVPEIAIKTIDEPLRLLHEGLWLSGIYTIPSCSGHNHPLDHYEQLFSKVVRECYLCKTKGLSVINVMNGTSDYWFDEDLRFPWTSRAAFILEASQNSHASRFGFRLDESTLAKAKNLAGIYKHMNIKSDFDGPYLCVDLNVREPTQRHDLIKKYTEVILKHFC